MDTILKATLKVKSYYLNDHPHRSVFLERVRTNYKDVWAIRNEFGECLNKNGEWEYEPSPSNRTEEFCDRCRWNNLKDALCLWNSILRNKD